MMKKNSKLLYYKTDYDRFELMLIVIFNFIKKWLKFKTRLTILSRNFHIKNFMINCMPNDEF